MVISCLTALVFPVFFCNVKFLPYSIEDFCKFVKKLQEVFTLYVEKSVQKINYH